MTVIEQTRVTLRRRLFMLGLVMPIFLFLFIYTVYLVVNSSVPNLFKLVAVFISTIIYTNMLSGFSMYSLRKNI